MSSVFHRPALPDSLPAATTARAGRWSGVRLAGLVLLAGLASTLALWRDASTRAQAVADARFDYRTERIRRELESRLDSFETQLTGVAALIGTRSGFDRSQWRRYFEKVKLDDARPGRLLIGYAPRVPLAMRATHELGARSEGLADYSIRSSGGSERNEFLPLTFVRRLATWPTITPGEDLADDPVVADAILRAARTGRPVLAGPLRSSPSTHEKDQVWAVIVAVFGGAGVPDSELQRQSAAMGFVIVAFNPMAISADALRPDTPQIGLEVRDGQQRLFTAPELKLELAQGFAPTRTRDTTLRFGERDWALHFVALPGDQAAGEGDPARLVAVSGTLVSLLLAGLAGSMANRRARALGLVAERTTELQAALARSEASESRTRAVVDHALDAIITIDESGVIQSFNPAAERMFGRAEQEVIGRNVRLLMPSPHREQHDGYLQRHLATGERRIIGIGRQITGLHQDGRTFPIELGISSMQIGTATYFCGIVRDISQRVQWEQALQHSERKLRSYIEQSLDGVMVVDADGRYLEANPAALELLGYPPEQLLQMSIRDTLAPDAEKQQAGADHFRRVVQTGRSQGEVTLRRADGSLRIADVAAVALGDGRYLGLLRDVTERHQASLALQRERELLEVRVAERTLSLTHANTALQQEIVERRRVETELVAAREHALQAAEAKAGFLANMSHEIRTPMNAVIGMTALLEETSLNAEQRDYVQAIRTSGDALLSVINDILDFSKVESGMLELEHRPFDLEACIEEAVDMLAPPAAAKGVELLYSLGDGVPSWIVGDANRLRQVFVNLLSNAIKFTEHGEVCLSSGLLAHEGSRLQLQFAVRDTGIGIPAAQQHRLFRAFAQADPSTTRKYGGTGLGLAICQRLVQLMGGAIGLESTEGQGSTFAFTITAEAAASGTRSVPQVGISRTDLAGRRALLVDDNLTNLKILQTQCRRWGMEVSTVPGAKEALAALDKDRLFDVVVLDLHMPRMDGTRLAQQIRWLCPGTLPALVLLSSGSQREADPPGALLFAATLAKPVKHSQLFDTLSRVLYASTSAGAPADSSRRLDPTTAQRLPLKILVAEDSPINQKLAVGILAKLGYASEVATSGIEALRMVRQNDYDLVLMDLQMPEMDGLEATRRIVAELPAGKRPRIVAMTANALTGDRERCLDAGMDDYIAKPVLPVDLQALIERLHGAVAPTSTMPTDGGPMVDQRVVDELRQIDVPGQPSLVRSLLRDYLEQTPTAIADLRRHADRREATHLAQRAHRLAGVSASLGACGMNELCVAIEQHVAAGDLTGLAAMIDQLELRFARTRGELERLL